MRVCLITPAYPYPNQGVYPGIERNASELAWALQDRGVDIEILTTYWNGGADEDSHRGIPIHREKDTSYRLGQIGRLLDAHYLSFGLRLRSRSSLFERCDVTHSFMPLAMAGWIRDRTPLVSTFQHIESVSNLRDLLYLPVHHHIEQHMYSTSNRVIVPSVVSKEELVDSFNIDPDSVVVTPHGVNVETFSPSTNEENGTFRVLFVGPLEDRKNVPTLVRAVATAAETIGQIELHIAGSGSAQDEIEHTAKERGIADRVTFHGHCVDDKLVSLYRRAHVLGFPSHKEGFGMVMIEAMACGTPVIAPDEPPFDEVVGEAGILTNRDSESFATALISVASNRERLSALQKKAIERASRQFDWRQTAEEHRAVYNQLIAE